MLTDWLRYISKRYRFNKNWSGRELFFVFFWGGIEDVAKRSTTFTQKGVIYTYVRRVFIVGKYQRTHIVIYIYICIYIRSI